MGFCFCIGPAAVQFGCELSNGRSPGAPTQRYAVPAHLKGSGVGLTPTSDSGEPSAQLSHHEAQRESPCNTTPAAATPAGDDSPTSLTVDQRPSTATAQLAETAASPSNLRQLSGPLREIMTTCAAELASGRRPVRGTWHTIATPSLDSSFWDMEGIDLDDPLLFWSSMSAECGDLIDSDAVPQELHMPLPPVRVPSSQVNAFGSKHLSDLLFTPDLARSNSRAALLCTSMHRLWAAGRASSSSSVPTSRKHSKGGISGRELEVGGMWSQAARRVPSAVYLPFASTAGSTASGPHATDSCYTPQAHRLASTGGGGLSGRSAPGWARLRRCSTAAPAHRLSVVLQ